jgi:DnaJ-class molecular chaperone
MKNLYEVLGVSADADATIIKRRYRELARELHPDLTKNDKAKERRFKEVAAAYAILGDETRRSAYDRERSSSTKAGSFGGKHGFGMDFDGLVDRIKTDGLKLDNIDDLLDEFLGMAKKFHEEAPKKVAEAAQDPGTLFGLMEDLFGVDRGTVDGVVDRLKNKVTLGSDPKPRKK